MIETSGGRQSSAFSRWLRTGKLPPALSPDGLELKFNPWHDPADGRFTFEGAGRHYGTGGADVASGASSRTLGRAGRAPMLGDRSKSKTAETPAAGLSKVEGKRPARYASPTALPKRIEVGRPGDQPNPMTEFVGGLGEGLYDVGKETVSGIRAALTTNPVTTVRDAGRGLA